MSMVCARKVQIGFLYKYLAAYRCGYMTRKGKNPISSKKKRFFFSHYNDDLPKETLHVYIYSHCNHTQWAPQFKKEKKS